VWPAEQFANGSRGAQPCEMTWCKVQGSAAGFSVETKKPSVPKRLEGLRKLCELYQLFSSFLRGASRPKSPRAPLLAANLFMLEGEVIVKAKVRSERKKSRKLTFSRPKKQIGSYSSATRPYGQLTSRRIKGEQKLRGKRGVILSACGLGHGNR
jgi:hypothetical protein